MHSTEDFTVKVLSLHLYTTVPYASITYTVLIPHSLRSAAMLVERFSLVVIAHITNAP
jgi:hypothetical protein